MNTLRYPNKRICGLWLIWVSFVILIGLLTGGEQKIQMAVFSIGYVIGFISILGNKSLNQKLSFGPLRSRQKKISFYAIILFFVLMVLIGGPYFQDQNYRMIWLGAFLALGIHFVPFAWVHGKSMLALAVLISANSLIGIMVPQYDFNALVYVDIAIKVGFGVMLLFTRKPITME
ncbi:hypothetical protein BVG16_29065 [Paenibacillus selenitireducens]|uniref:Uncharacterized protein n=2 Tax=Paenibacillus selenitireducens TaxID=1324314 RepID=A0A1T2X0S8_9BACL|nr:hypothetical protein BVG16_29065 [Paenibacillus selenitireducens]